MRKNFFVFLLAFFMTEGTLMTSAQEIKPGVQTLCEVTLPASTSRFSAVKSLGVPAPLDASKNEKLQYWAFIPTDRSAESAKGLPLLIFLHGLGECGSNPDAVKKHGPPKILDTARAKNWPFITVSPQCPAGKYWSPQQILLLVDAVAKKFTVDSQRIYLTGLSMGGFGTWMILNENPNRFAAAAPVCGGGDPAWAKNYVNIPIWIFHGGADNVVNPKFSHDFEEAIKKAGGSKCKLTIYPGVGHDAWTRTYNNPELYKWFLSHKLDN